ncbi:hypothetical protein M422DRAFT_240594 [Sphaerobolus stellatus SS14]|nr:hypothetical protein M422DRAFT_240594 [Sphaerobolus stellatus SS14]
MTRAATSLLPILSSSRFKVAQGGVQFAAPESPALRDGAKRRVSPTHRYPDTLQIHQFDRELPAPYIVEYQDFVGKIDSLYKFLTDRCLLPLSIFGFFSCSSYSCSSCPSCYYMLIGFSPITTQSVLW